MNQLTFHPKRRYLGFILGAVLTCGAACAQSTELMRVNLPYDLTVGKTTLSSGQYIIVNRQTSSGAAVLEIQSESGASVTALFQRIPGPRDPSSGDSQIVVHREGSTYLLDRVWTNHKEFGYELLPASSR